MGLFHRLRPPPPEQIRGRAVEPLASGRYSWGPWAGCNEIDEDPRVRATGWGGGGTTGGQRREWGGEEREEKRRGARACRTSGRGGDIPPPPVQQSNRPPANRRPLATVTFDSGLGPPESVFGEPVAARLGGSEPSPAAAPVNRTKVHFPSRPSHPLKGEKALAMGGPKSSQVSGPVDAHQPRFRRLQVPPSMQRTRGCGDAHEATATGEPLEQHQPPSRQH